MTVLTAAEYRAYRRHGNAGPLTDLEPHNREHYAALGANAWQLANEHGATVLRPVRGGMT